MTRLLTILLFLTSTTLNAQNHYNLYEQADFVPTTDQVQPDGVIYRISAGKLYKRVYTGGVNVRWFGAKGDGKTDDTKAIQRAIDLYNYIYIPSGTYVTTGIRALRQGIKIYGDGRFQTVLIPAGKQEYVLSMVPDNPTWLVQDATITGIGIDGKDLARNGLIAAIVRSKIEDIRAENCKEYGILHRRGFTNSYREVYSLYNGQAGIMILQEGNLLKFDNCTFSLNNGDGVVINSGSANTFLSCSIEGNHRYGALLTYQTDTSMMQPYYVPTIVSLTLFQQCYLEGNQTNLLIRGGLYDHQKVLNTRVTGCHFGDTPEEVAIDLVSGYDGVTLEDNYITYTPWRIGLRIGQSYLAAPDRARLYLRGNSLPVESIFINGAILNQNRQLAAKLLGVEFTEIPN